MENLCITDAFRDELNKNLCLKMHLGMYTVWPQMVQGGGCTLSGHRWCTRGRGGQSVFVSYRDNFLGCGGGGGAVSFRVLQRQFSRLWGRGGGGAVSFCVLQRQFSRLWGRGGGAVSFRVLQTQFSRLD